jgi:hypothetical protein
MINRNLTTLHEEEEKLRAQSLAAIEQRSDLRDRLAMIAEAMDVIYAFSQLYQHANDDEMTLQLLGIRLFNATAASIKLALSGYYQKAFHQVRDVIETGSLVDYLVTHPAEIAVWKAADKKTRKSRFSPDAIRKALDKRDGFTSEKRKAIYDLISESASHASYRGFSLVVDDDRLGKIGPFFDEKKLIVWLKELVKYLTMFATILVAIQDGNDQRLLGAQAHYLHVLQAFAAKYFPGASSSSAEAAAAD